MNIKNLLMVSTFAVSLGACQTMGNNAPKATMGTLLGGAIGGIAGSQVGNGKGQLVAVGLGAVLGAFMGNSVGSSLDELDKIKIQNTSQRTLERAKDGQVMSWNNPNSGNSGTVTPTRTVVENNTYCREYQQTVTIDGKTQNAYGKACRQTDGSWNIKS
tara:strand:+ start:2041 stop:2517 length:477 start_codon:yes stop_codon:yes gene_type:complete